MGNLVSVISGDFVRSRKLNEKKAEVNAHLLKIIDTARDYLKAKECRIYFSGLFRGDSFQCALSDPIFSIWLIVFIKAEMIKLRAARIKTDVRLGLGVGTSSKLNEQNISASDGEAFQLSGQALDSLKKGKEKYRWLGILGPWPQEKEVLSMLASSIDAIIRRWTLVQADAISLFLRSYGQQKASEILRVTQPAVQTRLRTAGHFAIRDAMDFFTYIVKKEDINTDLNNG